MHENAIIRGSEFSKHVSVRAATRLLGAYRRVIRRGRCAYCGVLATTADLRPPRFVEVAAQMLKPGERCLIPCCAECNQVARWGSFKTIAQKRREIQGKLENKYDFALYSPEWDDDELAEMGYSLTSKIEAARRLRTYIRQRLSWRNSESAAYVLIAQVRSSSFETGRDFANANATMPTTRRSNAK